LGVDDQFELVRLYDWQIRELLAFENAARIRPNLTIGVHIVGTVAHQPAHFSVPTVRICCGEPVERCELGELETSSVQECSGRDKDCIGARTTHRSKRGVDFSNAAECLLGS
jgi:hypothetical protein